MRAIALTTLLCGVSAFAHAQGTMAMMRIRGTLVAVSPTSVRVQPNMGEPLDVRLEQDTRIARVAQADLADIKAGSYVGTAAVPQDDGTLRALEVHVFDESLRGAGDGHRPWDLGENGSMTNGTVGDLVVSQGRTITVRYRGGEQRIAVPAGVPVVRIAPGDRTLLVPGAHVMVFAHRGSDGALSAQTVSVGEHGLVPPM
ncbi:DUF5666 domain-containing protein [Pararobbsia silviterrae]|uniref:Uncharacterized protein n=1 Tax=Pararobbsia silviterrae TaxID=1792498 RepID=A0A494WZ04_9BURK|nr:DUF5666 domain-containing protein [Pararobbsia silviterrae]RKP43757.1 hypothetical protein D7S86_28490 [Pararobbsia silviterrae]